MNRDRVDLFLSSFFKMQLDHGFIAVSVLRKNETLADIFGANGSSLYTQIFIHVWLVHQAVSLLYKKVFNYVRLPSGIMEECSRCLQCCKRNNLKGNQTKKAP